MSYFDNKFKIPIVKGSKVPAIKKWEQAPNQHKIINTIKYDTALITGKRNNIIILDVDIKDEGMEEIKKYIKQFGTLDTLTIKTPSGGLHYYFKYFGVNEASNYLIKNVIKNRSKYRNKGLDIRTTGGYIKAPPSENYDIINNVEVIEMTEHLLLWLLEDMKIKKIKIKTIKDAIVKEIKPENNKTYNYNINSSEVLEILKKLNKNYSDHYDKWLMVLTVLKNLSLNGFDDAYKIFVKFSKKNKLKFDEQKNLKYWELNTGLIDINYLILHINDKFKCNINLIGKYKKVNTSINKTISDKYEKLTFDKEHLEYEQAIFNKNDTLIIKSTTGTGKTTSTAAYFKKYQEHNPNIKMLSLVSLINLSQQQIVTFKKEKVELISYKTASGLELQNNNIVCCINSLHNKIDIDIEEIKNYVIYIDEVNSFIQSLLYNDTLNAHLSTTYTKLMFLIKHCKKLIVSDATINENIFNLLKIRNKENNMYIVNTRLKYKDVAAIRYNDENLYFEQIKKQINELNFFWLGFDSKTIAHEYHDNLIKLYPHLKHLFVLITATSGFILIDAKEQLKGKFVFFSPSITSGVDFTIESPQDVFIYIKGNSIAPVLSFQQATRTRNIKTLHYYSCCKEHQYVYNSLEEVKQIYKNRMATNEQLLNICASINDDETYVFSENTFFNLFTMGIFEQDKQNTNKLLHFEEILKNEGFKCSEIGTKQEINKQLKKEMTTEQKEKKKELINNYITDTTNYNNELNKIDNGDIKNLNTDILQNNIHDTEIYKNMITRKEFLKIKDIEMVEYSFLLSDEYKYSSFFSVMNTFKTNKEINMKIKTNLKNNMAIKTTDNINNKIKLFRMFENDNNISAFDLNFTQSPNIKLDITNEKYNHLKTVFRITKKTPENINDMRKMYIGMLKNIYGSLNIITSKKTKNKERKDIIIHSFDSVLIKQLFKLSFRIKMNGFDDTLLKIVDVQKPENNIQPF